MKHTRKARYILIAIVAFSFWSLNLGFADEVDQQKLNQLNDELSQAQQKAKDMEDAIKTKNSEIKELNAQISDLESKIVQQEKNINAISEDINATRKEISNAEIYLAQIEAEMAEQDADMSQRVRTMYKTGETSMLEILLTSESVTDLMNNVYFAQKIVDDDIAVLEAMQAQHEKVEEQKATLEGMKAKLEKQQAEQEAQKQALLADQNSVSALKQEASADKAALEKQLNAFNKEADALTNQIKSMTNPDLSYEGGLLNRPVPSSARETSQFGYRNHPILKVNKLHTGLDWGVPTGTTISAAAGGTVIKSGWNKSYGYVVMIDHGVMEGAGSIVTVYAHNSKLLVNEGATVSRGQAISLSGSTGDSTGPHLHFEVRVNGEYKNPKSYL